MSSNAKRKARKPAPGAAQVTPAGAGARTLAGDVSPGGASRGSSADLDAASTPAAIQTMVDLPLVEVARELAAASGVEAAAVRDGHGRISAAGPIELPSLRTSAVRAAVTCAVVGGARSLQSAVLVSDVATPSESDLAALLDLGGPGMPIVLLSPGGAVRTRTPVRA